MTWEQDFNHIFSFFSASAVFISKEKTKMKQKYSS